MLKTDTDIDLKSVADSAVQHSIIQGWMIGISQSIQSQDSEHDIGEDVQRRLEAYVRGAIALCEEVVTQNPKVDQENWKDAFINEIDSALTRAGIPLLCERFAKSLLETFPESYGDEGMSANEAWNLMLFTSMGVMVARMIAHDKDPNLLIDSKEEYFERLAKVVSEHLKKGHKVTLYDPRTDKAILVVPKSNFVAKDDDDEHHTLH